MLRTLEPKRRPATVYRTGQIEVPRPVPRSSTLGYIEAPREASSGGGWIAGICVVFLTAALFGLSAGEDFLLGQAAATVMGPLALIGLWRGGVRKVFMFSAILAVAFLGPALLGLASEAAASAGWQWSGLNTYMAGVAIFFSFLLTAGLLAKAVRRRLVTNQPALATLDRTIGAVVGAGEGAFALLSLCWLATMLQPAISRIQASDASVVSPIALRAAGVLSRLGEEAGSGWIGDVVRSTNMIERTPLLREMVEKINSGGGFDMGAALEGMGAKDMQGLLESAGGATGDQSQMLEQLRERIREHNEAMRQLPRTSSEPRP